MADNISTGILSGLYEKVYNPDVLSCLANLSSDEVFTPPEIVNKMLDMLPQELFSSPDTKFLDPAVKTGVFLREIAKRLIKGLEAVIPDRQQRIDHIFKNQLYGIAITELTSLLSRRSLYCSKYANSAFSVTHFENSDGNIRFKRIPHSFDKSGRCIFCGASETQYDRGEEREYYAYEWIHTLHPEEIFGMKFDVIISNPPYQLKDGGAQASAKPIYQYFVETAKNLKPRFLTMIIPARWYAGGKGLDEFRDNMITDIRIRELHDFPDTNDCFPGVNIRGGICYFLWKNDKNAEDELTTVVTHIGDDIFTSKRKLKYKNLNIFIRYNEAISVLDKVITTNGYKSIAPYVSVRKPFGFATDFIKTPQFHKTNENLINPVLCYGNGKTIGYVEKSTIPAHNEWIDKWKIFVPRANNIGTELNDDNLNAFVGSANEICTESYIVIGANLNLNREISNNFSNYLKTKFARFLHSLAKSSQDASSKTYSFVPLQDFSKPWTDSELYEKYNLTDEEINFIESMIRPMDLGGENNG